MIILEPLLYHKYNTRDNENIEFKYVDCVYEKEILNCDRPYEGFGNGYASVVHLNDKIRFYYRACNVKNSEKMSEKEISKFKGIFLKDYEYLCVAESSDGLNFVKPKMKMIKFDKKKKNNIIKKHNFCHNFFANYDHNLNKFIGISGLQSHNGGIFLFESSDGYNWEQKNKLLCGKGILPGWRHPNHFDTLSVLLYNPVSNLYFLYTRHNNFPCYREVQVAISKDLGMFKNCRKVKMSELGERSDIYLPGIFFYPGTNYFLAHTCTHGSKENAKFKSCALMISNDGMNFDLIKEDFIFNITKSLLPVYGMIEINDKFLLYVLENEGKKDNSFLCYSFKKNRIGCLASKDIGSFKTHYIKIKSLIINYETEEDGCIDIEMYSKENELIERIDNIKGNEMNKNVEFQNIKDDEIYIKFILKKAKMYSFSYYQ